jgi:hypothetical protein
MKQPNRAKKQALHTLWGYVDLTILPANKGNTTAVLSTVDYTEEVTSLLDKPVYKELAKNPTQSMEWRIALLIKGSSLP